MVLPLTGGSSSWTSATSITCVRVQTDKLNQLSTTISSHVGTISVVFSFDAPVISMSHRANSPHDARYGPGMVHYRQPWMTLSGYNFGNVHATPTIIVDSTDVCITTAWASRTVLKCAAPFQYATGRTIAITMSTLYGTFLAMFTYDGGVITSSNPVNTAGTAGTSMTLLGLNFSPIDATISANIRGDMCNTLSWSASTSVRCSSANWPGQSIEVSVAAQVSMYCIHVWLLCIAAGVLCTSHVRLHAGWHIIRGLHFRLTDSQPHPTVQFANCVRRRIFGASHDRWT